MAEPTPQELRLNIETINENLATLNLKQDKDSLVLYGSKDVHFPGVLDRLEALEEAMAIIKSQRTLIKGMAIGLTVQGLGIVAILGKMFS